jgi:hypothetical protein
VGIANIATQNDAEMLAILDSAHMAEVAGNAAEAEYRYWRCTTLYPFNGDVSLKYGNALFRQNKFQDAECWLRNARALGVTTQQCIDTIQRCLSQQGLTEMPADKALRIALNPAGAVSVSASYPDLHAIRAFSHVLLGEPDPSLALRLDAQRKSWDAESLLLHFAGIPEFRYKNPKLFPVLKKRIAEGLI